MAARLGADRGCREMIDPHTISAGRIMKPHRWHAHLAVIRRVIRNSAIALTVLCALLGFAVGMVVVALHLSVRFLHESGFNISLEDHLSSGDALTPLRILAVPVIGGVIVGLFLTLQRQLRPRQVVDPIEANALFGGKMSLGDSSRLTAVTLLSNGAGVSLGMEAAYSQAGAAIFSVIGQKFGLRRSDLRGVLGAGAAAGIAAAFNAPLAGAFYAFERVLGAYTPATLAIVGVAAATATLVRRAFLGAAPTFAIHTPLAPGMTPWDYLFYALLGIAAGQLGVITMKAVVLFERAFPRLPVQSWARPVIGGLMVGVIALAFPEVLGSGHGALVYSIDTGWPLLPLTALLAAKILASAISLGSGFRGGLFSSSLFIGSLFGALVVQAGALVYPALSDQRTVFMLVGMGAMAAAVIGSPMTMVMLVLESTGDFAAALAVLAGVVTASLFVRVTFGYSFATWRFHLRGVPIHGAHDVGWIADLKVARMMREDGDTVPVGMPLARLREAYPLETTKYVFAVDAAGHYAGVIDVTAAHNPTLDAAAAGIVAGDLAYGRRFFLLADDDVRTALKHFEEAELEALPVLDGMEGRVVGYLTETYALRRYSQEIETRRAAELGERDLFESGVEK